MTRIHRLSFRPDEDEQADADRQTASLAALALVLFLVVVGLFLVRTLAAAGAVEDCLMAGSHDCDTLIATRTLPPLW